MEGLMQKKCNSIALAMELHLFYIKPLIWDMEDSKTSVLHINEWLPALLLPEYRYAQVCSTITAQLQFRTVHNSCNRSQMNWMANKSSFWQMMFSLLADITGTSILVNCLLVRFLPVDDIYKYQMSCSDLTHWGRVTHICVSEPIIIGSDNGLSPGWR